MSKCDFCKYPYDIRKWPCEDCLHGDRYEPIIVGLTLQPRTNADRIRAMTDEELVDFLCEIQDEIRYSFDECDFSHDYKYPFRKQKWLDWLKTEGEH